MHRSNLAPLLLLGFPVAVFSAFFLVPLAVVALSSITDQASSLTVANYVRVLFDLYHWDVLLTTFRVGMLTTLACVVLGYPLAYYLVRVVGSALLRRICVILLIIPLFTSNIVRSFGWMVLLGRNGLVNDTLLATGLIDRPVRLLGTELGILIGLVYILIPFVVLTVGNALSQIDTSLEQASADLGARPATTFWTITLPLSLPGLTAGAILVFSLAVSAYVTPALLSGGQVTVFSILIFQQYSTVFDFHFGGALSITLLVLTLLLIGVAGRIGAWGRQS